jgi:hypothetical protein
MPLIDWTDANPFLTYYKLPSGAWAYHTGSDINLNTPTWDADENAPVYATAHGFVAYARRVPTGTWGNLIVLRHILPSGKVVHSRYGHLRSMAVVEGEFVTRGTMIGRIGGEEFGLPNHLHFDISPSGVLEGDPRHWPGTNRQAVIDNYVPPRTFLAEHGPVGITPQPPPPPPPTPVKHDIFAYMAGDGRMYGMHILWGGQQHHQQMQTQLGGDQHYYQVKNAMWEEFWLQAINGVPHVFRGIDSSHSESTYYLLSETPAGYGSPWCPRFMAVGDVYERNPFVSVYHKKTGAMLTPPTRALSWLRLTAHYATYTPPGAGALTFHDVIRLDWLIPPNRAIAESYYYARGYGLIGWSDPINNNVACTIETFGPGERQPFKREAIVYAPQGAVSDARDVPTGYTGHIAQWAWNRLRSIIDKLPRLD